MSVIIFCHGELSQALELHFYWQQLQAPLNDGLSVLLYKSPTPNYVRVFRQIHDLYRITNVQSSFVQLFWYVALAYVL